MPDRALHEPKAVTPILERLFESIRRSRAAASTSQFTVIAAAGIAYTAIVDAVSEGQHAAYGLLGVAGILAYKLWLDRDERGRLAIMDGPGGRKVTGTVLDQIDLGAVGIARGNAWAVFETPVSPPRMMNNREYDAFRKAAPYIVEIEVADGLIGVGRYVHGLHDSSVSGKPAAEIFDASGTRLAAAWYLEGVETSMSACLEAQAARAEDDEPGYGP